MPANFSPHQIYVYSKYLPNLWLVARIHGTACWAIVLLCVDLSLGAVFCTSFEAANERIVVLFFLTGWR